MQTKIEITYQSNEAVESLLDLIIFPGLKKLGFSYAIGNPLNYPILVAWGVEQQVSVFKPKNADNPDVLIILKKARAKRK